MAEKTYQQQIAEARAERHRYQAEAWKEEMKAEYQGHAEARKRAEEAGDVEAWHTADDLMEGIENEWARLNPPTQQDVWNTLSVPQREFLLKNQPYMNRIGQQNALKLFSDAHNWALRTTKQDSPEYFEQVRSIMEMNAEKVNSNFAYDRAEETITEADAARMSGLSPQQYQRNKQIMAQQGRFSWQDPKQ